MDDPINCPVDGCTYSTPLNVSKNVACTLLAAHSTVHMRSHAPTSHGPKLERPKVDVGLNEEEWNIFKRRWDAFVIGSGLDPASCSTQLFQCAGITLGDSLLKSDPTIVSKPTADLLKAMKDLAVIAVATGVTRAELLSLKQERDEQFRTFAARVRGKAETCKYTTTCVCTRTVDFTDSIIRDVLIAGIDDTDIRREILGTTDILEKTVNEIVTLVESKEMARNALPSTAAVSSSSYSRQRSRPPAEPRSEDHRIPCPECSKPFAPFRESKSGWNSKPFRICIDCHRSNRNKRRGSRKQKPESDTSADLGATFSQVGHFSITGTPRETHSAVLQPNRLGHSIFSKGQWRKARFRDHPKIDLELSVSKADYNSFKLKCPAVKPTLISALADSGAQSCLWSFDEFLAAGFTAKDLIPVNLDLVAANRSPIIIEGAALIRLTMETPGSIKHSCATMVYISRKAKGFFLSMEAMIDLGILPETFPDVGSTIPREASVHSPNTPPPTRSSLRSLNAGCSAPPSGIEEGCSCPSRTVVPELPTALPFDCTPENNDKMKEWILQYFASSTFNTCPHQPLPHMTGPPVEIHLKADATPSAVHTPAPIPLHWQEQVKNDLLRDEALKVIERVPYGEPVTWCHRMVVTRKHDGQPRRTVDLSPLNKHCDRETFAQESPFHLARRIPPHSWKSVMDAWNGFHSVPLRPSDRHLTTFITPFGRWRYLTTPQGFTGAGDGYNQRYDEILSDFERKESATDDTCYYDYDLTEHWWRTLKFVRHVGLKGIILNPDKFQFAQRSVDFAGFRISETSIEPLPKYTEAIRNFPTPKSTTDIRSWFGLVNQVSNYAQLRDTMAPFKPFLSPKCSFQWTPELDAAFEASKETIVNSIRHGVEIFDPARRTCLRPDWSRQGIGYFLLQKHCPCDSLVPDCCVDGWKIVLAGSRFLSATEQRYAPIEGECLAVVWGLEQTKYFTQGSSNLVVVTDHKPLTKILGDRTLDEISNTRIFRLKQRTLPWSFDIAHLPGKTNVAADATSRHPVQPSMSLISDEPEQAMSASITKDIGDSYSVSWAHLSEATSADPTLSALRELIENGLVESDPLVRQSDYWQYRDALYILDDVIMYQDRVVIPPSLRGTVLQILHSANQGVSAMESRARATVFWPGMTKDIRRIRETCAPCNRNAPSQPATPATPASTPSTPFECVFADFFKYGGWNYLVAGDRLSGWVEVYKAQHGTSQAGAKGLIAALRTLFATFGVPMELSSDGGPEFDASETESFFKRWGVHHRISSAYFPQSNGRAEVAVKKCKRLLIDNVGPDGSLNNDNFLRALLQIRNTPDPDCNVSPAEIVFGRPLRDSLSFTPKLSKFNNPDVHPTWRDAWHKKEDALRTRFTHTAEKLNQHARQLPPLKLGTNVLIQNQNGRHATKWDKSGTVVEARANDQYIVKVDGSGRLTLRNRRFLRAFTRPSVSIHQPTTPTHTIYPQSTATPRSTATPGPTAVSTQVAGLPGPSNTDEGKPVDAGNDTPTTALPVARLPADIELPHPSSSSPPQPPSATDQLQPVVVEKQLRRSTRVTRPPRIYAPETGTWD